MTKVVDTECLKLAQNRDRRILRFHLLSANTNSRKLISIARVFIPQALAFLGAIFHLIPDFFPFFAPSEWAFADGADFGGEV
jgi:hypothetical protein